MDYVSLAFLLAVLGFALIIAELFIPSGGLITVGCIVCFVSSIWFAYRGWWASSQGLFWTFSSSLLVGIPIFLLGILRLLETTRLGDRILLAAPKSEDVTPHLAQQQRLQQMIGKKGRTLSMLNPGGMVARRRGTAARIFRRYDGRPERMGGGARGPRGSRACPANISAGPASARSRSAAAGRRQQGRSGGGQPA